MNCIKNIDSIKVALPNFRTTYRLLAETFQDYSFLGFPFRFKGSAHLNGANACMRNSMWKNTIEARQIPAKGPAIIALNRTVVIFHDINMYKVYHQKK
jgi:hypothetical protein